MSGAPDYGPGDLVVCVDAGLCPVYGTSGYSEGVVYIVDVVGYGADAATGRTAWAAKIKNRADWRRADCFRRIDPKPPEFWTGTVDADAGEQVPA